MSILLLPLERSIASLYRLFCLSVSHSIFNILILINSINSTSERTKDLRSDDSKFRYLHLRCLYVSASCASVSVVMVVIEVYALLALQFCDGEDLMSLYWATWTMLQFGSVIAIFGIILHMALVLQGHDRPPWALALGTPVLVVAGLGNLVNSMLHRKGTKVMERTRSRSRANSKAGSLSMSQT